MRCEPILRELAVPTGSIDRAELAEHLATCPTCVDQAERTRQFDRLWDATRPAEPSKESWVAVWASISRKAESRRPILAMIWPTDRRRRAQILGFAALAQAAALLIAGLVAFRGQGGHAEKDPIAEAVAVHRDVAERGETLFICLDAKGRRVDSESRLITPGQLAAADVEEPMSLTFWDMELINSFEGAE